MRRTELSRRTPLRSGKPLERSCELLRRTPLNPVSDRRKRDNRQRTVIVNGLRMAQGGQCPRCRRHGAVLHGHELRPRSQGGSILAPEVALCDPCNSAVADSIRVSCWNGWYLSPKWPHDPALELGQARDLFGDVVVFADLAAEVTA